MLAVHTVWRPASRCVHVLTTPAPAHHTNLERLQVLNLPQGQLVELCLALSTPPPHIQQVAYGLLMLSGRCALRFCRCFCGAICLRCPPALGGALLRICHGYRDPMELVLGCGVHTRGQEAQGQQELVQMVELLGQECPVLCAADGSVPPDAADGDVDWVLLPLV